MNRAGSIDKIPIFASFSTHMNYTETLTYLFSQLPMYQRIGKAAYKANLDNTLALDEHFGHPHRKFKSIHVAGTNGKGSTSHTLASVLQQAGYRVGLYTSPHLRDFRERIRVNGVMIPEDEVVAFVATHMSIFEAIQPSFFEMTVALAFDYFAQQRVDVAVVEVGLGGRLDSTNIISPEVSVITNIAFDHVELLGDTLQKIASEKAGIIKPNTPVVVSQQQPEVAEVFVAKAHEVNAPLTFAWQAYKPISRRIDPKTGNQIITTQNPQQKISEWEIDLLGNYQRFNLPGVLATVDILRERGFAICNNSLLQGIKTVQHTTGLMGRWQKLGTEPQVICDTGHNVDGIAQTVEQIKSITFSNLRMVIGMVGDKNIEGVLALLPKNATYYFTKASIPRSLDENVLMEMASSHGLRGSSYPTVHQALAAAKHDALPSDLIYIGGSTFVVAEVVE